MPVDDGVDLAVEVASEPVEEAAHHLGSEGLGNTMKCIRPLALIADMALADNRLPVRRTTGVFPLLSSGAASDLVGSDADLVGEQDLAAVLLRLCTDRGPGHLPIPGSVSRSRYSFAISSPTSRRVHNCPLSPTSQDR
ncbi:hypothetical protein [Streptomyces rubiginosohelvolus]|uniref:hypothetical protein n=1 Tax=Streptomyces rubiginosohelvolus TaxID=67362 RepID=UPI003F4BA7A7